MSRSRHKSGFTLLELVLLLLIMAVVSTIAAPTLQNFGRGRMLPNTATEFITVTQWARAQAISEGYSHRVNIDPVAGKWWVSRDDGSGSNFVDYTDGIGKEFAFPDGLTVETTVPSVENGIYLTMDPTGRTDTGTFTFRFRDNSISVICETPLATYHIVKEAQ